MAGKSKVLIIGGTGYIGKFIVEASAKEGHPTFALVRESAFSDPVKGKLIDNFKSLGVQLLYGDLYDHESLVKAIKQVDVVISAVGHMQIADQVKIIAAIKEAGNVKLLYILKVWFLIRLHGIQLHRFFPSEFGNDVDRVHAVEPATSAFAMKAHIRRAIEAEGIPYTYVPANCFAGYFLPSLCQAGATAPPRDKVVILGDGNPKEITLGLIEMEMGHCSELEKGKENRASVPGKKKIKEILRTRSESFEGLTVFNHEGDIGTFTIKAVDDPRTLNKVLFIRPPKNTYSLNELVALWEKLIGKTLEKTYVPEDQLLKQIQEAPIPINVVLSINHSIFVKGDHTNFEIEPSFGFEASELYPDVKYTTVEEYLSRFV
ncbi:NmrA-like domain - like 10 [Theobroma cacao]|nr:NmrA-like domain - like 10 [Theobroma cacao]